jgi:acyl carrier protein
MPAELTEDALTATIEAALRAANANKPLSAPVTMDSHMGAPREWDSMSFVAIFLAVGERFEVDLDDDDAIHFRAARSIHDFLKDIMA